MAIFFEFSEGVPTDGMKATLFKLEPGFPGAFPGFPGPVSGIPLPVATIPVANSRVEFPTSAPGDFALVLKSDSGPVMRSGPMRIEPEAPGEPLTFGDTFFLARAEPDPDPSPDVDPIVFTPAMLQGLLPALPVTSGADSITSITLTLTPGAISLAGTGTHTDTAAIATVSLTNTISFAFTYSFDLVRSGHPVNLRPVVRVRTLTSTVTLADGSALAFLVDPIVDLLIAAGGVVSKFADALEAMFQAGINRAIAGAIAGQDVRPTSVSVESIAIAPATGVSVRAIGCVSARAICAAAATGGSVRLRPRAQLNLMRRLRDEVLAHSPRGIAYRKTFARHNRELAMLLIRNPKLLALADQVVEGVMQDFPPVNPGKGQLSRTTARRLVKAMDATEKLASAHLALAIRSLRDEVAAFVGKSAEQVLNESWAIGQADKGPSPAKGRPPRRGSNAKKK